MFRCQLSEYGEGLWLRSGEMYRIAPGEKVVLDGRIDVTVYGTLSLFGEAPISGRFGGIFDPPVYLECRGKFPGYLHVHQAPSSPRPNLEPFEPLEDPGPLVSVPESVQDAVSAALARVLPALGLSEQEVAELLEVEDGDPVDPFDELDELDAELDAELEEEASPAEPSSAGSSEKVSSESHEGRDRDSQPAVD